MGEEWRTASRDLSSRTSAPSMAGGRGERERNGEAKQVQVEDLLFRGVNASSAPPTAWLKSWIEAIFLLAGHSRRRVTGWMRWMGRRRWERADSRTGVDWYFRAQVVLMRIE